MPASTSSSSPGSSALWRIGRRFWRPLLLAVLLLALGLFVVLERSGQRARPSRGMMCDPCERASDCRPGLGCVNGTCETAPPSCHVKIGL